MSSDEAFYEKVVWRFQERRPMTQEKAWDEIDDFLGKTDLIAKAMVEATGEEMTERDDECGWSHALDGREAEKPTLKFRPAASEVVPFPKRSLRATLDNFSLEPYRPPIRI